MTITSSENSQKSEQIDKSPKMHEYNSPLHIANLVALEKYSDKNNLLNSSCKEINPNYSSLEPSDRSFNSRKG